MQSAPRAESRKYASDIDACRMVDCAPVDEVKPQIADVCRPGHDGDGPIRPYMTHAPALFMLLSHAAKMRHVFFPIEQIPVAKSREALKDM